MQAVLTQRLLLAPLSLSLLLDLPFEGVEVSLVVAVGAAGGECSSGLTSGSAVSMFAWAQSTRATMCGAPPCDYCDGRCSFALAICLREGVETSETCEWRSISMPMLSRDALP